MLNSEGGVVDSTTAVSGGDDQTSTALYEYSVWANSEQKFTFVPRDSRYAVLFLIV